MDLCMIFDKVVITLTLMKLAFPVQAVARAGGRTGEMDEIVDCGLRIVDCG